MIHEISERFLGFRSFGEAENNEAFISSKLLKTIAETASGSDYTLTLGKNVVELLRNLQPKEGDANTSQFIEDKL